MDRPLIPPEVLRFLPLDHNEDPNRRALEIYLALFRLPLKKLQHLRQVYKTRETSDLAEKLVPAVQDFCADCQIAPGSPEDLTAAADVIVAILESLETET